MKRGHINYIIIVLIVIIVILLLLVFKKTKESKDKNLDTIEEATEETLKITGCYNKEACLEYCEKPENYRKCSNFVGLKVKTKFFFSFPPGNCQNKEECDGYCKQNLAECRYYANYAKEIIKNVFEKNYSEIIIPVPSPGKEVEFYKIASSHFIDPVINKEFENFRSIGINSYNFWVEASYVLGDVAYDLNLTKPLGDTWPGYFPEWKTRAAYLIAKSHLNGLKFIYSISPTDWDLWESPKYENPSKELIEQWLENYIKVAREVAKFAQETNVDILIIGANPQIIRIEPDTTPYFYSVYERFLQEMLKEARKWYNGKLAFDFGGTTGGLLEKETPFIPEIGKFDYVIFTTTAKSLDEDDIFQWTNKTLKAIINAKKIVEKNNAKGIILNYEFGEKPDPYGPCESIKPYPEDVRINLYDELINNTKEHVVGFMPITTPYFACDPENLLKVTKEWFAKL